MDENPENGNGNTDLMQDQTGTDFLVVGIGASAGSGNDAQVEKWSFCEPQVIPE